MESADYKPDKLAIYQEKEERLSLEVISIEDKCNLPNVSFIKESYNFVKIRDRQTDPDIKMLIGITMAKISVLGGFKNEIDQINKQDILKLILSSCSDLTLEDICKAFELERYGELGAKTEHFQLFNAEYVASVLNKYRTWKTNIKFQHNITKELGPANNEISEEEKKNIVTQGIIRVFNSYKENKELETPNAYIFDELFERKIIRDAETEAEKLYYAKKYNQAADEVEKELDGHQSTSTMDLKNIRIELEKVQMNKSEKVIIRCKGLILKDYFDKLIRKEKLIEEILK